MGRDALGQPLRPCYNGAAWLAECLEALLAQSRPADEVLVVDDGSTDDSAAIARSYGPRSASLTPATWAWPSPATPPSAPARGRSWPPSTPTCGPPRLARRLLDGFTPPPVAAVGGRLVEHHQSTLPDRWRGAHGTARRGLSPPQPPGAPGRQRRRAARPGAGPRWLRRVLPHQLRGRRPAAPPPGRGYLCRYQPGAVALPPAPG